MEAPIIVTPIPDQITNERAAFGPIDFINYIHVPGGTERPDFSAEIQGGAALPKGMICTRDGIFTGIPATGTEGVYDVTVTASNEAGEVHAKFIFTIKSGLVKGTSEYLDKLKSQVWEALDKKLPLPDLSELYDRPITPQEMYYLLERWGVLKIWDAFNLETPGEKVLLNLEGTSKHYNVYDRGSCLIAAPKDLFSYERTIQDGIVTARAMAREVYQRNWTVELVGIDKLTRAAWIELRHLGDRYGNYLEVVNYEASHKDLKLYAAQADKPFNYGME